MDNTRYKTPCLPESSSFDVRGQDEYVSLLLVSPHTLHTSLNDMVYKGPLYRSLCLALCTPGYNRLHISLTDSNMFRILKCKCCADVWLARPP